MVGAVTQISYPACPSAPDKHTPLCSLSCLTALSREFWWHLRFLSSSISSFFYIVYILPFVHPTATSLDLHLSCFNPNYSLFNQS